MTLRPFKITYKTSKKNRVMYSILDHRGQYLLKDGKLGKKFFDKLLSYPITAFGCDIFQMRAVVSKSIGNIELNPKFDKKDVIKALDFWIEYFVYQNKCDYILENTVNKDFELHLEELIRVREAVLKDPIDTKYVRQKIRKEPSQEQLRGGGYDFNIEIPVNGTRKFYKYDAVDNREITNMTEEEIEKYSKMYIPFTRKKPLFQPASSDQMVEFTENVLDASNTPFSTVDQFCYKIRTMTRKEYEEYKNKPYATGTIGYRWGLIDKFRDDLQRFNFTSPGITTAGWFSSATESLSDDEITPARIWGARHTDGGGLGSIIRPDEGGRRTMPTEDGTNPNNWVVVDGGIDSLGTFRIINTDGVHIAGGFTTRVSAELYLINIREQFLPSEVRPPTETVDTAEEEIRPGDVLIRDENGRWRRATSFNPVESLGIISDVSLGTEPSLTATDGFFVLPVDATAQSITIQDDEVYENMIMNKIEFSMGEHIETTIEFIGPNGPLELKVRDGIIELDNEPHEIEFLENNRVRIDENTYWLTD